MDFFGEQRRALGQSKRLVVLFAIAVALIVVVIGAIAALGWIAFWDAEAMARGPTPGEVLPVALVAGLITLAVIALASWTRTSTLRHGGGVVAQQLGGTLIPPDTTNPSYRRLRNVVEEMAIASGVPVPEVYVLEQEAGINAFAAGYTPSDAAIGVTRGTLEQLSRTELQGVIAHEFSHILNGDMRLNIRLVGLLFGILVLSILARTVMRGLRAGRSNNRGAAPIILVAVAVAVIGSIGVFFGRVIKAGLSRQREYLADASAVQFTRDNTAVAGALKKIAITAQGSKLTMADGEEFSHMLFGDGIGYSRLFATHPPLMERIRRLDPSFRPEELEQLAVQWQRRRKAEQEAAEAAERQKTRDRFPGGLGSLPGTEALPGGVVGGVLAGAVLAGGAAAGSAGATVGGGRAGTARPADAPEAAPVARQIGNPSLDHVRYAELLRADLPPALADAAHMHDHAIDLVLATLVDAAGHDRSRHLERIGERRGPDSRAAVEALLPHFAGLHPVQRAPLLAVAFPALKRRPGTELEAFRELVEELIHLDGEVTLFEYALGRDLAAHLDEAADPPRARLFGPLHLPEVAAEAATVLAVLAMHGHDDPEEARRAYLKGLYSLLPQASIPYVPPQDWVAALDEALPRLDRLEPVAKSLLLEALLATLHHDGRIRLQEAELLRAVCAALHCPLPPLLPQRAP
jgi:Zn-dependent protease with chaperone function